MVMNHNDRQNDPLAIYADIFFKAAQTLEPRLANPNLHPLRWVLAFLPLVLFVVAVILIRWWWIVAPTR
jgi:hypothetical protein